MSAKERHGTNGCSGSSLSPHSQHCCTAFHLSAHAGFDIGVSLPALSTSLVVLFLGFNLFKGSSKAQVHSHTAVCFAVSNSQSLHLQVKKSSLCRELRALSSISLAFSPADFSVCCANSVCPHQALCLSCSYVASTWTHKPINHKSSRA